MSDSRLLVPVRDPGLTFLMQGVQVSQIPQCQGVKGQIDESADLGLEPGRPYTIRRDVSQIPIWERWKCPNKDCGRMYKRTSTISIGQHRKSCDKRPVVNARSIFDQYPNASTAPIAAIISHSQISSSIHNFQRSNNHENGNISTTLVDRINLRDYSQVGLEAQLTPDLRARESLGSRAESKLDNSEPQDRDQQVTAYSMPPPDLVESQSISQLQQPCFVNSYSTLLSPQLRSERSMISPSVLFSPLPATAFSNRYRNTGIEGVSIMRSETEIGLIRPIPRKPGGSRSIK